MKSSKTLLFQAIFAALILSLGFLHSSAALAQEPTDWQGSATGLSVTQNDQQETAGLGFVIRVSDWPSIYLRGGVRRSRRYIGGPVGIDLGSIKIRAEGQASLASEDSDWARNEMSFTSDVGSQLKLWVSRLTPALLVQSSSNSLRLLAGNVTGNTFDGSTVTPRPEGPSYPKYVAYLSGGNLQIQTLTMTEIPLSLDQNWLLVWYGNNSHFVETKKPLTYTGYRWGAASLPQENAYQADAPLLLAFQNPPSAIKHSDEGGVEVSFAGASGYVTLLPLLGRDHPNVTETETWSQGLPHDVLQKTQWWAEHLCSYPVSVSETYAYDEATDIVTITENFDFLEVRSGGTTFAPIPPMLAIGKDALNVVFSGSVIDGNLYTEFGPSLGIENTQAYTWSVSGLKRYTDARRIVIDTGEVPGELEQELVSEAEGIITAGHFVPWIFTDKAPFASQRGDIYWLNPADVIYHLTEIADALPDVPSGLREDFLDYIKSERLAYPPEDVSNLPLDGVVRGDYSEYGGQDYFDRWASNREDVFLKRVPLYSFFALSRYYELIGDALPLPTWQKAQEALDRDMSEQDWATFYWFSGYHERPVAVVNANRHFAGLVGFVKLAKMAGDAGAEDIGRALLAKAAVLRLGMAKYPRYLYSANLIELPCEPDWQPKQIAFLGYGPIFNYHWTAASDDARQVAWLDQFGVYVYDHSGFSAVPRGNTDFTGYTIGVGGDPSLVNKGFTSPYLTAYRDMVPELFRFLTDFAQEDVEIYLNKVEALFPHWYVAFAEGMFGSEHNLQHPIDSFQMFIAKTLIQEAEPQQLAIYVDIPWLREGDLFYVHKLAETIKAYRGTVWDDTVSLSGAPGERAIHLSWRVYTTLPPLTWRINYDGPTGEQPSPVTGLPGPNRAYTLTGLTNYTGYIVTLTAMYGSTSLLASNTVMVTPTGPFTYLPLVLKAP